MIGARSFLDLATCLILICTEFLQVRDTFNKLLKIAKDPHGKKGTKPTLSCWIQSSQKQLFWQSAAAKPCTIYIDANGVARGAVLTRHGKQVAFKSCTENDFERGYLIYDTKLLAVVLAIKMQRNYLRYKKFYMITDPETLIIICTKTRIVIQ